MLLQFDGVNKKILENILMNGDNWDSGQGIAHDQIILADLLLQDLERAIVPFH